MRLRSTRTSLAAVALLAAAASACSGAPSSVSDGGAATRDAGAGLPRDAATSADLRGGILDLGGEPTLGCKGALECANTCLAVNMDETARRACTDACRLRARSLSVSLLRDLYDCLETACPSAKFGDACFDRRSVACEACYREAQGGGACGKALSLCIADVP